MLGNLLRALASSRTRSPAHLAQALRAYERGNPALAEALCERHLADAPGAVDALVLLALCGEALGKEQEARAAWQRVRALDPDNCEALWAAGKAHAATQLERGPGEPEASFARRLRFAREMTLFWGQQDRLWRNGVVGDREIRLPVWNGGPLAGKRILLHSMRGFGDTINFARFARDLAHRGASVRLECGPPLHRLLARCPEIADTVTTGASDAALHCDVHAPLVVLLKHFFFRDLACRRTAHLEADREAAAAWEAKLKNAQGLRVGLCWAGDPANKNDTRRSVALAKLRPVLECPGIHWVSLQKGGPAQQLAALRGVRVDDWTADLADFDDTAALIDRLDLVLSVNTAVAHLAGALGKPVWILYSEDEDRRWEVVSDARAIYARARLFRRERYDWDTAIGAVATALREQPDIRCRRP